MEQKQVLGGTYYVKVYNNRTGALVVPKFKCGNDKSYAISYVKSHYSRDCYYSVVVDEVGYIVWDSKNNW